MDLAVHYYIPSNDEVYFVGRAFNVDSELLFNMVKENDDVIFFYTVETTDIF